MSQILQLPNAVNPPHCWHISQNRARLQVLPNWDERHTFSKMLAAHFKHTLVGLPIMSQVMNSP